MLRLLPASYLSRLGRCFSQGLQRCQHDLPFGQHLRRGVIAGLSWRQPSRHKVRRQIVCLQAARQHQSFGTHVFPTMACCLFDLSHCPTCTASSKLVR